MYNGSVSLLESRLGGREGKGKRGKRGKRSVPNQWYGNMFYLLRAKSCVILALCGCICLSVC